MSYKTFLKHFRDQANGAQGMVLISDPSKRAAQMKKSLTMPSVASGSLVLVDFAEKENENERGETLPKIEIVDPSEGDRRRALDEVAQEQADEAEADSLQQQRIKPGGGTKRGHNSSGGRRGRNNSPKRKKAANSAVKKVKDLFDN